MKNIMLVEAEIWKAAQTDKGSAVLIRPLRGDRVVPIFIGQLELQSILIGMRNVPMPRPLTHDLMLNLFEKTNVSIERIEITDLKEATFYARVIMKQGIKKIVLDARPSDALALSCRANCPVYIAEYIIDEAGIDVGLVMEQAEENAEGEAEEQKQALEKMLENAVAEENYEEAAKIRDMLNEIADQE